MSSKGGAEVRGLAEESEHEERERGFLFARIDHYQEALAARNNHPG
jgi:hypothetical protein